MNPLSVESRIIEVLPRLAPCSPLPLHQVETSWLVFEISRLRRTSLEMTVGGEIAASRLHSSQ